MSPVLLGGNWGDGLNGIILYFCLWCLYSMEETSDLLFPVWRVFPYLFQQNLWYVACVSGCRKTTSPWCTVAPNIFVHCFTAFSQYRLLKNVFLILFGSFLTEISIIFVYFKLTLYSLCINCEIDIDMYSRCLQNVQKPIRGFGYEIGGRVEIMLKHTPKVLEL